jgi:hypothetical protein
LANLLFLVTCVFWTLYVVHKLCVCVRERALNGWVMV